MQDKGQREKDKEKRQSKRLATYYNQANPKSEWNTGKPTHESHN